MPQVAPSSAKARARRLREAGDAARAAYFDANLGREVDILLERDGRGYTPHYAPLRLSDAEGLPVGAIVRARVTGHDGKILTADPIS